MRSNLFKSCILIIILSLFTSAKAQESIGLRFFGLSIHPHGEAENASIMPLRLDKEAYFVQNLGGILSYELPIYKDFILTKTAVALYSDCAAQLGGFVHLGLRARIFTLGRHSLYGGLGPTLIFRKNWLKIPEYKDPGYFKGGQDAIFQHLFIWYAGDFDYRYKITDKWDLACTFVPGYPDLISLSIGFNYRLR
ncbi:Uncharacterised protein [Porphyromonas cangingivalis]|uniref:hypothetical protein n=1 Tax=Porphyromonas cangingivalis TaxID=36874 RepID=UPI000D80B562|nr:hypothetical protein [Porphyromonas cangingivalis]SPY34698.1 Uncharacterised protein [Porphyromonas cangingivalis]